MSWIDKSAMTEPALLALLRDGERLIALCSAKAALSGVERITAPSPTPPAAQEKQTGEADQQLTGAKRAAAVAATAAAAVGFAAIGPTGWSGGDLPERLLGGTRVFGAANSAAVALFRSLEDAKGSTNLVITDRRLLVVRQDGTSWVDDRARPGKRKLVTDFSLLAEFPREVLVAARRRGRLFARGRVELYFGDRSMVAVMTGLLLTGPARRILRALALPRSPKSDK